MNKYIFLQQKKVSSRNNIQWLNNNAEQMINSFISGVETNKSYDTLKQQLNTIFQIINFRCNDVNQQLVQQLIECIIIVFLDDQIDEESLNLCIGIFQKLLFISHSYLQSLNSYSEKFCKKMVNLYKNYLQLQNPQQYDYMTFCNLCQFLQQLLENPQNIVQECIMHELYTIQLSCLEKYSINNGNLIFNQHIIHMLQEYVVLYPLFSENQVQSINQSMLQILFDIINSANIYLDIKQYQINIHFRALIEIQKCLYVQTNIQKLEGYIDINKLIIGYIQTLGIKYREQQCMLSEYMELLEQIFYQVLDQLHNILQISQSGNLIINQIKRCIEAALTFNFSEQIKIRLWEFLVQISQYVDVTELNIINTLLDRTTTAFQSQAEQYSMLMFLLQVKQKQGHFNNVLSKMQFYEANSELVQQFQLYMFSI